MSDEPKKGKKCPDGDGLWVQNEDGLWYCMGKPGDLTVGGPDVDDVVKAIVDGVGGPEPTGILNAPNGTKSTDPPPDLGAILNATTSAPAFSDPPLTIDGLKAFSDAIKAAQKKMVDAIQADLVKAFLTPPLAPPTFGFKAETVFGSPPLADTGFLKPSFGVAFVSVPEPPPPTWRQVFAAMQLDAKRRPPACPPTLELVGLLCRHFGNTGADLRGFM